MLDRRRPGDPVGGGTLGSRGRTGRRSPRWLCSQAEAPLTLVGRVRRTHPPRTHLSPPWLCYTSVLALKELALQPMLEKGPVREARGAAAPVSHRPLLALPSGAGEVVRVLERSDPCVRWTAARASSVRRAAARRRSFRDRCRSPPGRLGSRAAVRCGGRRSHAQRRGQGRVAWPWWTRRVQSAPAACPRRRRASSVPQ
jgi:hypothetical protein